VKEKEERTFSNNVVFGLVEMCKKVYRTLLLYLSNLTIYTYTPSHK